MALDSNIPNELIDKVTQDKCVAFVGAGLSIGAGLPDWPTLMRQMVDWCNALSIALPDENEINALIAENEFLMLADTLIDQMGDGRFRQFMGETFRGKKVRPTETHKLLPKIPFAAVLTSNYDKFIEGAYAAADEGQLPLTFTHLDARELSGALQTNEFHILKTHGSIDRIDSVVLSGRQYRRLVNDNNAYKIYLQQILTQKTVLFLGFSLTDPDLLSILSALRFDFQDDTAPHYALMDATKTSSIKIDRFRKDYNINIIPYTPSKNTHPEVAAFLEAIIARVPKKFLVHLEKTKQDLENLDSHYKLVATTDNEFYIHEKYPGASEDKPLTHSFRLQFDTRTEEGREVLKTWQNLIDTGEEAIMPPPFVASFELPEILQKAFGNNFTDITITAKTYRSGEKFNVRYVAAAGVGETAVIDNIQLECVSSGEKQTELNNESQNHFFKAKMILFKDESQGVKSSFECNYSELNVAPALTAARFFAVMAKGATVRIEFSDTGLRLGEAKIPPEAVPAPDPLRLRVLEALFLIQQKTGVLFSNPVNLKGDEIKTIFDTAYVLQTGRGEGTLSVDCNLDSEAIGKLLSGRLSMKIENYAQYVPLILGQTLYLGSIWMTSDDPILIPGEKERLQKTMAEHPDEKTYVVGLRSSTEKPASIYYLDFLSAEDFEKLHKDTPFRQFTLGYLVNLLVSSAEAENRGFNIESLASFFETAKNQLTGDGRPLNMLGRCSLKELIHALRPHLSKLSVSAAGIFLGKLVELNLLSKKDFLTLIKDLD